MLAWQLLIALAAAMLGTVTAPFQRYCLLGAECQTSDVVRPSNATEPQRVNRSMLNESLELGKQFLLRSQRSDGLFRYHVNFLTGEVAPEQGAVRQAGALWGLALIHQDQPTAATRAAVLRGLAFFHEHSRVTDGGRRYIRFPGTRDGSSGTVALVALTLIDFLRVEPSADYASLRTQLGEYLAFLVSLRRSDRQFHRSYLHGSGEGWGGASPYFDGEILLALVKAARYAGRDDLKQRCLESAEVMQREYVETAIRQQLDLATTKGFFQWGVMAYRELHDSHWEGTSQYARRAIDLAKWMIDVHRTLERRGNTAYAYEGIICAHYLAKQIGDANSAAKLHNTIEKGLAKLISWQVGGPIPCKYLRDHAQYDSSCKGGVLGGEGIPWLRIDTTQHQMHAIILARRYVWSG